MFSSNQILQVSGSLEHPGELKNALHFALVSSGYTKSKIVYQITEDGRYCIGWVYDDIPEGWSEYPFEFSEDIVALIITQFLEKQDIEYDEWEGSYDKGFLMEAIEECLGSEDDGINEPFYGIVTFEPYTVFYSK